MRARTGSGDREHHATGNHGIKAAGRGFSVFGFQQVNSAVMFEKNVGSNECSEH